LRRRLRRLQLAVRIRPTVILQDLVMPEVNGLTLVQRYRATVETRDIPIIVLSTKEDPAVKKQAFVMGANDLPGQAAGQAGTGRARPLPLEGVSQPTSAR